MIGRGLLGKYGPNQAADPLVLRKTDEGVWQVVVIQRDDTLEWALPGGMVEDGESVSLTLKREFKEEARNVAENDSEKENKMNVLIDELFESGGQLVYRGYVKDPRNTDWAWMETTAKFFVIKDEYLLKNLTLKGGSDALHAKWLDVFPIPAPKPKMYANHYDFVEMALIDLKLI